MNFLATPLAALALLIMLTGARAGEIRGQVVAIDRAKMEIMLNNGLHYRVGTDVSIAGLRVGAEVKITYIEDEFRRTVTRIVPADLQDGQPTTAPRQR